MLPVIFRFLNDLSSIQPVRQSKKTSEAKRVLIETVTQISTRCLNQGCFAVTCFASHYFFPDYRTLKASGSIDEIRQVPGHYRQQLTDNTSTFMRSCIKSIGLLVGQPFSLEKIPKTDNQSIKLPAKDSEACQQDSGIPVKFRPCSNIPANIRTDIRNTMKKAGYHPDKEGICYGLAWAALLACVRQKGQVYMQRMQYLAHMDTPPLPGIGDTHQVYPFFDAVTLSMTSYKNMRGYEKGIGYPGRQEVAFPGRVIGSHEPDYQVPVVKQTFIAECTPETFIRFLQQTRENNNGIPFGVMIHYPGHATGIGFDGSKWLATAHDNHYYTETTERLYSFFDEQSHHYKDGRIIAAMEMVAGNENDLNITGDTLVVNVKKSVSAPLALHLALQYGDANVTTDCITMIGRQAHTHEILLEQLTCKDARGTPGLYMALQKGHADAITAFMQTSAAVIAAIPLPEAQKAELLHRLFSSKNACLYPGAQTHPQETAGGRGTSRKRTPSEQTDAEAKRSKTSAQTRSQETTGKSIPSRKRTSPGQADSKAKRKKRSAVKEKQGDNLQASTTAQESRQENPDPRAQNSIDIAVEVNVLQGYLKPGMNDTESVAAKKLFQILNSKKIKIKKTFYKMLANNVDRKDLSCFCAKASTFFEALTDTVKDTGCLTGMLGTVKKYSKSFVAREDAELEYLAGLDTFRCFSSMNNYKGLPKKEAVEEMLGWDVWKQEGVFSMELFRALSSMNSKNGLPKKEAVEAILDWQVWKLDGAFNMELFRAFSSMNRGRGLPKKEAVEEMLGWEIWKLEDVFNMELFRAFSSMNHSKGLPKKEMVEAVLNWEIWKHNGVFSMELFRAFSSINHSKGLPKKEAVEAVLDWDVWKQEGVFNMELFRAFSSMNSGKGFPNKEAVKAVLGWDVWKPEGVFSMVLFRAFSSMNNGKGLPKKEEVEAFLDWEVWKPGGVFNLELFRAFSSMNNGKGLPKKEAVKAFLDWEIWKPEGVFNLELFRIFSSMNSGKGLPKKEVVEAVLGWDLWKLEGVFSIELFRAFSSMNHGKGLPKKEVVEAVLGWDLWKLEGVFSIELFRAFSSMNHGKGLPKKEEVKAVLDWELWKPKGVFSMELFRSFSSMNNCKGLPKKEAVKAVLGWELWKQEGMFNMELFRAFSSINHSKGLPKKEAVKALLDWELWKPKGVFSMELFRAFSSINHGKGLPKKEAVKAVLDWELWKPEGVFSMELFRAFSSMNSGKCLPKKKEVEAVLDWDIWKPKGVFSMELFRAFSSMNHGKGLPKKEAVEAVLDWDIWKPKGVFSIELFRAFSSMNHGNGLPKKEAVEEMLGWLKCEENPGSLLFRLINRLHVSEGIPDIKKLKQYEQKLLNLFFADSVIGSGDNDKNKHRRLIQPVVLFLSTRKPQYILNFRDVEHFYQQVAGEPDSKLEKLLKLLISYGGECVSRYLTLNDDQRESLIELSSLHAPLPLTMQAVTDFSPQERKLYLFFTRNLKAPPDKDQWSDLGLQLRRLASVLKTPNNQRRYLEIIWHLAPSDRNTFLDEARVECIISVFPSLSALEKLAKSHSQSGLKALFKACEQFIQKNPSRENIERLFAALLETRLFLYLDDDIPDHFLSEYTAVEGSATFIAVTPETGTTEKLALYFVASVTMVLSRMFYYREANRLKIRLCKGQIESFQIPALEIQDKGIKISNWPVWMFLHFLAVTEFPKSCYFSQEDWQQYCNPMFPLSLTQDKSETSTNPPPVTVEETLSEEEQFQRLWENLSRKALLEDVDLQVLTGYEQYMTMDHIVKILDKVHTSVEPHKLDKLKQLLDEKKTLYLIEDLFPPLSDEVINYLMETEIPWIPE